MKKRILSMVIALALCFTLLPATALAATSYNLWVGGVEVTSDNASNILGNGTASYNYTAKTLTLDNANITSAHSFDVTSEPGKVDCAGIYYNGSEDLTIKLEGHNTIVEPSNSENQISSYGIYI